MNRRKIFLKWSRDSYKKACKRKNVYEYRQERWGHQKALCFWLPPPTSSLPVRIGKNEEEAVGLLSWLLFILLYPSFKETLILIYITYSYLSSRPFLLSLEYMVNLSKCSVTWYFLRALLLPSCSYWNLPLPWGRCCPTSYISDDCFILICVSSTYHRN